MLIEETPPFLAGFIFWTFPTAGLLFLTSFLERYTWLNTSSILPTVLVFAGVLMVTAGGFLAAFQKQLGRILAYGVLIETGFSLLALSVNTLTGVGLFFTLFIPRLFSLVTWSSALTILQKQTPDLNYSDIKGWARPWPYVAFGIGLASLSLVGFPVLAGFPVRQALVELLARHSAGLVIWIFLGSMGFAIAVVRAIAVLTMASDGTPWEAHEAPSQRMIIVIGCLFLLLLGLFPQWITLIVDRLPVMFQHLGQ